MPTASVVGWSSATFPGFGPFSPRTATMLAALAIGALTVSMAAFPIDEMSPPPEGAVTVAAERLGAASRPPSRSTARVRRLRMPKRNTGDIPQLAVIAASALVAARCACARAPVEN
jgi:hypothetical protein